MLLSIIIPAYNEEKTIEETLKRVLAVDLSTLGVEKEIIVVDDGSTDSTRELVKNFNQVRLLKHNRNIGKGRAILTGFEKSRGEIVLIQDADLEYNPQDYARLITPIIKHQALVVYGTRFSKESHRKDMCLINLIANRVGTILTNLLYNADISDEATCYKVFTRNIFKDLSLKCNRFGFDPEVTAKILKKKIKICEVPISYIARRRRQGKKFTSLDGLVVLWTLIRLRVAT